jgi:glycosyl transferase family 25
MKAFVISLPDSHQRRIDLTKTLADADIKFEFFNAIKGGDKNNQSLLGYNDQRCQRERGYSLTLGEQGCFASHRSLWLHCIELNEPILIMEDDVHFSADIDIIYPQLDELTKHYTAFKLGHCGYKKFIGIAAYAATNQHVLFDNHQVVKYLRGQRGSHAYIVTPIAAKKWVDNSVSWWQPVDDYQETEHLHGVLDMGIEPQLAFQSDAPSDIGGRGNRHSKNLYRKIIVQYYRMKYDIINFSCKLYFLLKQYCKLVK